MSDEELSDAEIDDKRGAPADSYFAKRTECPTCKHVIKPFYAKCPQCEGDANRLQADRLRTVIAELKESIRGDINPERERELVGLLSVYQHPDAKGFLSWLMDQRDKARANPNSKRRGR